MMPRRSPAVGKFNAVICAGNLLIKDFQMKTTKDGHSRLGDFTTDTRVLIVANIAIIVGTASVAAAVALINLIRLATNIAYFGRFSLVDVGPSQSPFGLWVMLIPVAGSLLIGLIARYGSEKIRGHGIP